MKVKSLKGVTLLSDRIPEETMDKYYIMQSPVKPYNWVLHTQSVRDIPIDGEALLKHLQAIQSRKGYVTAEDVQIKDLDKSDSNYKLIATWWDEPTALANSQYRLEDIKEVVVSQEELWKEIFKLFQDEVLEDNLTFEQFLRLLQRNYEVKRKV